MANYLDEPLTFEEFITALRQQKERKAPGENGIPAEAYKYMDDENSELIHELLLLYWQNREYDIDEWHYSILNLIAKKGDLSLPKNWRPICLLDTLSNILSAVIQKRLDKYLTEVIGLPEQCGFSSGRGCTDGTFCVKTVLQNLKLAGHESYILYVDLVKAFDSVNRDMLWQILGKFGVPEGMVTVIQKLYTNIEIICNVNGVVIGFKSLSGVKQGDNLAPILFLFAIQAALEHMSKDWPVKTPPLEWCPPAPDPKGTLTTRTTAKKSLELLEFTRSLYADDASFVFMSRNDMIVGTRHVIRTFAKFGLEVHTGYTGADGKVVESKTEFIHIPCFGQKSTDADTAPFEVNEGRFVTHTPLFRYLGTLIEYTLLDNTDIDSRIQQAQGAFEYMRPVLLNKKIPRCRRARLFQSLIVNVALWGGDSWSLTDKEYKALDVFQNRCVRRMNHVTCFQLKEYHLKQAELNRRLNLLPLSTTCRIRQLRFLEKIAHMPPERLTRRLICSQAIRKEGKRCVNGAISTTKRTYAKTLIMAGLCTTASAPLSEWIPAFLDPSHAETIEENLGLPAGSYHRRRKRKR